MFSCEFCENFKRIFVYRTPSVAASGLFFECPHFNLVRYSYRKNMYFLGGITRSSRPEVFCKKGVLKNFAKFTRKQLCHSFFSKKLDQKRDSERGVFLWILRNFLEQLFLKHLRWLLLNYIGNLLFIQATFCICWKCKKREHSPAPPFTFSYNFTEP